MPPRRGFYEAAKNGNESAVPGAFCWTRPKAPLHSVTPRLAAVSGPTSPSGCNWFDS